MLLVACDNNTEESVNLNEEIITIKEQITTDYAMYQTLDEKVKYYDTIVLGEQVGDNIVKAVDQSSQKEVTIKDVYEINGPLSQKVIVTLQPFRVDEVLRGNKSLEGEFIYVVQMGGKFENYNYIAQDIEYLKPNAEAIIFGTIEYEELGYLVPHALQGIVEIRDNTLIFHEINGPEKRNYTNVEEYLQKIRVEVSKLSTKNP